MLLLKGTTTGEAVWKTPSTPWIASSKLPSSNKSAFTIFSLSLAPLNSHRNPTFASSPVQEKGKVIVKIYIEPINLSFKVEERAYGRWRGQVENLGFERWRERGDHSRAVSWPSWRLWSQCCRLRSTRAWRLRLCVYAAVCVDGWGLYGGHACSYFLLYLYLFDGIQLQERKMTHPFCKVEFSKINMKRALISTLFLGVTCHVLPYKGCCLL